MQTFLSSETNTVFTKVKFNLRFQCLVGLYVVAVLQRYMSSLTPWKHNNPRWYQPTFNTRIVCWVLVAISLLTPRRPSLLHQIIQRLFWLQHVVVTCVNNIINHAWDAVAVIYWTLVRRIWTDTFIVIRSSREDYKIRCSSKLSKQDKWITR